MSALAAYDGRLVSTFHYGLANQQKINRNIMLIASIVVMTAVTNTPSPHQRYLLVHGYARER
jgi:hypothetical protein